MQASIHNKLLTCVTVLLIASTSPLAADETQEAGARDTSQQIQDAWVRGKLEAAYTFNRHLNPFDIMTDVQNGVVTLTGVVESEIDADLAAEIAEGVEGVEDVENNLEVDVAQAADSGSDEMNERRTFGRWVNDATTTAAVRTNLARNGNIKARDISIRTRDDVVTLTGEVDSEQESELAELVARNTGDVRDVENELHVRSE